MQCAVSGWAASRSPRSRGAHARAAIAILVAVAVARAPLLLQSVAGADEGLYALVAREWLHGHLPYTTVWETKPPLLFALLAGAFAVLGTSTLAMRLATDAAIALTALGLYAIGTTLRRDGPAVGLVAALFYAALTVSDSASSALAETLYAPFVVLPFALVRMRRDAPAAAVTAVVAGALLAGAILVKESALPEAAFIAIVVVRTLGAANAWPLVAGAAVAAVGAVLPYVLAHRLDAFADANYGAVARRAFVAVTDATPPLDVLRAQALAFFPATLLAFGIPWILRDADTDPDDVDLVRVALVWSAVDLATVVAIREYLGNHFIPAMAPAALLGALVCVRVGARLRARAFVPAVVALAFVAHCAYQFALAAPVAYGRVARHDPHFGDPTATLAAYIVAHAAPDATLYVADDRAILYVLTGIAPPTRFAYAPHLVDRYQETIAGIDGATEIARVMAGTPAFVVRDTAREPLEDPRSRAVLDRALSAGYHAVYSEGTRIIYARDAPPHAAKAAA